MRKSSSFMCVLVVLLAGGAEAQRPLPSSSMLACLTLALAAPVGAWDSCSKFKDIYKDGQDLCERMWGIAFKYEPNEERGFTQWFFGEDPNDAVAKRLGKKEHPDTCDLQYYHKSVGGEPGTPSPEGENFNECHPWKSEACCHSETVSSPTAINEAYGEGYHWDRCDNWEDGYKMSQACERFFVQEACMYECDSHAGQYRKYSEPEYKAYLAWNAEVDHAALSTYKDGLDDPLFQGTYEHAGVVYNKSLFYGDGFNEPNQWQIEGMPVKASYCDAFYTACYNDFFCEEGSFWGCAADYAAAKNDDNKLPTWAIVLIIVLSVVACFVGLAVAVLISREKAGTPMFSVLAEKNGTNTKEGEVKTNEEEPVEVRA